MHITCTTITLHYYSDNFRGLPRLRFYAVPDDFDIWDTLSTDTPHVDVTEVPRGQPAGHRKVSININFNTKRVLLYKYSSSFVFAVSEVDFFICTSKYTHLHSIIMYMYVLRLVINTSSTTTDSVILTTSLIFTAKSMIAVLRSIYILIFNATLCLGIEGLGGKG